MKAVLRRSCVLACLLSTGPAHADDDASRRGEALLREGVAATRRGDYARAHAAFLAASALITRAAVWHDLGLTEMKLGRPVEALAHYRRAASSPDLDAAKRHALEENIDDAYAATGHIVVLADRGSLITVDGRADDELATAPVDVLPGKHVIASSDAQPGSEARVVEVFAPANAVVTADLRGAPSVAGAGVHRDLPLEDGPTSAPATVPSSPVVPSGHPSESPAPRTAVGAPFWTTRRATGAVLGGVGALSLGAAAFFFAQVQNDKSEARTITSGTTPSACAGLNHTESCAALENAYASQRSDADWTLIFAGAGTAALAAGVALWLWPERASAPVWGSPVALPGGAAFVLGGEL